MTTSPQPSTPTPAEPPLDVGRVAVATSAKPTSAAQDAAGGLDLDRVRAKQDFAAAAGMKTLVTNIAVKKPAKQMFVNVLGDPAYRVDVHLLPVEGGDRMDKVHYLVLPEIAQQVAFDEIRATTLVTYIDRAGSVFLWDVPLPSGDLRPISWWDSARMIITEYTDRWINIRANRSCGSYDVAEATASIPKPTPPSLSMGQLLAAAFRGRIIDTVDHPVLRALRGEV